MDLTLHVADADGVINLDGIAPPGTHYTAARNENTGVVRLTPVRVLTSASKPTPTAAQVDNAAEPEPTDPAPWTS